MDTIAAEPQQRPVFGPSPSVQQTQPRRASFDELVQVKHLLPTGLYVKAYHAPAGLRMYTKQFDQDHMTILARGTALLEIGGQAAKLVGPAHCVIPAHSRVTVSVLEDAVWYCLHPTELTDLEQLNRLF